MTCTRCSRNEGGVWGTIIVLSTFMIQALAFGVSQTIGIYNVEFLDYFDTGAAAVSLVGAINNGVFMGAGPLASLLMSRYSHRQVCLLGAVLTSIGLVVLPFTPNLAYLYVFYGILTGLGCSLVYVPSMVLCGLYFNKHRSLATGVATSGSGFGSTIFPFILYVIIDRYGWKGSMFILAGLNLHLLIFAALLRPPPKGSQCTIDHEIRVPDTQTSLLEGGSLHGSGDSDNIDCPLTDTEYPVTKIDYTSDDNCLERMNKSDCRSKDLTHANDDEETARLREVAETTSLGTTAPNSIPASVNPVKSLSASDRLKNVFSFSYTIYFINNIVWNAGVGILMIFLAEYLITIGLDKEGASTVYTVVGGCICLGAVVGGWLGNLQYFDRMLLYIAANIGCGGTIFLFLLPPLHNLTAMCLVGAAFGLIIGVLIGLIVVVTTDLIGTEALGDGFGVLMFASGVGVFGGPPIAGVVIDVTGDSSYGILLSAATTVVGGVLMCIVLVKDRMTRSSSRHDS